MEASYRRIVGRWAKRAATGLWLPAMALWLPATALAQPGNESQQVAAQSIFECSACVGFRTLPYWGPVLGGLLLAVAFFLFVYQKPFPELPEDGPSPDPSGH